MKVVNGKVYIYQHEQEFKSILGAYEVDSGVRQLDCDGSFAGSIKKKFKQMTVLQRVIYMARNENHDGTTYNLAAQKLLEDAGIQGRK